MRSLLNFIQSPPSSFLKAKTTVTTQIRPFLEFSECVLLKSTTTGSDFSDHFLISLLQLWRAGPHTGCPHPQPHSHVACPGKFAFFFYYKAEKQVGD